MFFHLTVKDFTSGQTAYVIHVKNRFDMTKGEIEEVIVNKIGKKYVYANIGCSEYTFKDTETNLPYLIQSTEYLPEYFLFPTKMDAETFMQTAALRKWIKDEIEKNINQYQLPQLQKIERILKEPRN